MSKAREEEKAWQAGDQEMAARKRAKLIALHVKAEARGKTCGTCKHVVIMSHGDGFCGLHINMMTGNAIAVLRKDATACRQWRKDGGKK